MSSKAFDTHPTTPYGEYKKSSAHPRTGNNSIPIQPQQKVYEKDEVLVKTPTSSGRQSPLVAPTIPHASSSEVQPAMTPIHIETSFYEERVYLLYNIVNAVKLYPGGITAWLLEQLNTFPLSGTIEERVVKDPVVTGLLSTMVIVTMRGSDINCELACDDILISEKWSCELQSKRSIPPPSIAELQLFKVIPSEKQFPNKKVLSLVSTSETSSNFDLFRSCLQTEMSLLGAGGGDEREATNLDQQVDLKQLLFGELEYSITEVSSVDESIILDERNGSDELSIEPLLSPYHVDSSVTEAKQAPLLQM